MLFIFKFFSLFHFFHYYYYCYCHCYFVIVKDNLFLVFLNKDRKFFYTYYYRQVYVCKYYFSLRSLKCTLHVRFDSFPISLLLLLLHITTQSILPNTIQVISFIFLAYVEKYYYFHPLSIERKLISVCSYYVVGV